ncbi:MULTISPECIES: phage tail spike protein [Bacillus cereus group]|uniref:phage tail spike protein n=1 Tax=Bacillus cereus group TaxID=86661 RepID=UPI0007723318|nr:MULTISPECIES: phage tail spike protein [Bacillus cereus group]MDR4165273.1 peptidase S74 [Bacillus paranthracis]MDX5958412.1 phage tail spike protein [Bacillus cereus group sp. BfR-BA-00331]NUJ05341.1 peptidase S74 [Bacillus paranthracis]
MRTPSGELHVVDFKTEQIVASIQPADYWDDKRHWEIKNNIDTLEFRVFDNTRHSSTLMQQNLVLKEVRDGRIVPYVITEIEKNSDDRSVTAYASGEWIQLAKAGIIPPQKLEGKTVIEMVDIALAGTKWQKGNLEYASFRSMTIDEFIDPLSFLKKIASLFELEIQYRAEVVGSRVVGRYVDMVKKRGRETGKEITLGKDLMGIKRIENSQNICTALLGFVKKEGGEFITITEINNGVPYLVDSDAFQRWNEKGQHKFGFYSPETENEDMDAKRLMTLMKTELAKRVNTSVSYEVEEQSIGRVFGLSHELINEGDTIRIKDIGFTPKLYLEARVIAGDESFTDPTQDKYIFGDYHEIIDPNEELRKIYNRILSSLGNKQEMIDQLDKLVQEANETASNAKKESEAAKTLAEKVQENIKNNTVEIIEAKNPPTTGLIDRKTLWLDISNGKPGILKLWKDGVWDPVVPDIESVKNEVAGQFNEVNETLQGFSRNIIDLKNDQGVIDKKVTSIEQTANGLSSSVYNLNNIVDEQGKKLTEANTKIEQQATTIGAKVELKQVEDYVAGFKIPELKQTVNQNKQDLLDELANKLATEQFNQKMTLIDNRFSINEQGINASAKKTEVYTKEQANGQFATSSYVRDMETRLQLTEKGVSISVKENDVIAAFNMSKENITLNANRINLRGFITADHIKGQVLEGVTLKTSGNRFVEINKQDMKIFDLDKPRGYIGFMETNDGSIQPSLVLGSDNNKYKGTGSFYIYQTTPRINGIEQPSKAYAKFGISKGENAEGNNIWSNYIQMQNDGGHLSVYSDGQFRFKNLNDIIFESEGWAPGYGKFMVTTTEPHYFKNNYGEFHFDRESTGNSIYFANGVNDHDLVMGRVMIRSSLVSGYDNGLQIKDLFGNSWRDIELRTLRAKENISAAGRMWAQEFIPSSSRTLKTNIEDLPFSALDKINSVNIKQYHFIRDVERFESGESITLPINYGMIAEDSDDVFTTPQKDAVTLYSSVAISIQAIQEVDFKVKNLQFDHGMLKQEVVTLKEQLEAEKLEKVSMKAEIDELKVLVQQLINEEPKQP